MAGGLRPTRSVMLVVILAAVRSHTQPTEDASPSNASVLAHEMLLLKAEVLKLTKVNGQLKQDASKLSARLALLETAYHSHDRWEWAGTFDVSAGEYDWTFVGRKGDGANGHYAEDSIDVVLMQGVSKDLETLRPHAELLLQLSAQLCVSVYGSTHRPSPRIKPSAAGVCYRLHFDTSRDHTTFVISSSASGRLALFAQHRLADLGATRLLEMSTRAIASPVTNISCCADAQPHLGTGELGGEAQHAGTAQLFQHGTVVALVLSGGALLLSFAALCTRRLACCRRDAARSRPRWGVRARQHPIRAAIPMTGTAEDAAASAEDGAAPDEAEQSSTELQRLEDCKRASW